MGVIHENGKAEIAMAQSIKKEITPDGEKSALRLTPQGYASSGGYNLEPGHPDLHLQAAIDSQTEFGVKSPAQSLRCIHLQGGHALLHTHVPTGTKLRPEQKEFDPTSGTFVSITTMVCGKMVLRDLPTLDIYLLHHRLPIIQQYLRENIAGFENCDVQVNLEHAANFRSAMRTLCPTYGTLTIHLNAQDQSQIEGIFAAMQEKFSKLLSASDRKHQVVLFNKEDACIFMPTAAADKLWLSINQAVKAAPTESEAATAAAETHQLVCTADFDFATEAASSAKNIV